MPEEEHVKRLVGLHKLVSLAEYPNKVDIEEPQYSPEDYSSTVLRYPDGPEGGPRCRACFEVRLEETARRAASSGYDYFTTTLSVSPHKDVSLINEIGQYQAIRFGGLFLSADFKKRDGYRRSVDLSKQYGLYRQDYCGCKRGLD
jgi:predicted adenine nucleotide alpha hydrolase (AANH) superfamily ATPase